MGRPRSGAPARPHRRWRWCRRSLLALLACLGGGLLYLTLMGFPDFLKESILHEVRSHGIEIDVERLRLDWYRGLVAETVILAGTGSTRDAGLAFTEIAYRPKLTVPWRFSLRAANLQLLGGRLAFAVEDAEGNPGTFTADSIAAELHWLANDQLVIKRLSARAMGARLELEGALTNVSGFGAWAARKRRREEPPAFEVWQANLERAIRVAEALRFSQEPQLFLNVAGDADDLTTLTARIRFQASDAVTPWGQLTHLYGHGYLNDPTGTNEVGTSRITVEFAGFHTPWSGIEEGRLELTWAQAFTNPVPTHVAWHLDLERIHSPWGTSPGLQLTIHAHADPNSSSPLAGDLVLTSDSLLGGFAHAATNRLTARVLFDPETLLPTRADWQLHAVHITFPQGSARQLHFAGHINHLTERSTIDTTDWAWWSWLEPFAMDWHGAIEELVIDEIVSDGVELTGRWRAPRFELTHFGGEVLGSKLAFHGHIDVDTRNVQAETRCELAAPLLGWLLPEEADRWMQALTWSKPASVQAAFHAVWPGWTQDRLDWRQDLLPTLRLQGSLETGPMAYRELRMEKLHTHFSLTNEIWQLTELTLKRPEGLLQMSYTEDLRSRDYHLNLRSSLDPHAFEPLLGLRHDLIVDLFLFRSPPHIQGELWGSWRHPDRLGARATIAATDFSVREEDIDAFSAAISVTNALIHATHVDVRIGQEWVVAPDVTYDVATHWLRFTNATATLDPHRVGRVIGPKTAANLSPYEFRQPPHARVDGGVNVLNTRHADLRFAVTGGPFHYWRFEVPAIRGHVHWLDETLVISDLHASFYQGTLDGTFHVDIPHDEDSRIRFQAMVNRADFNRLVSDLFVPTNRLDGILNLNLTITDALARDAQAWQGFGRVDLRDGFLWDIPLFGLVSPVLDSVVPGLGRSRINGATATFHVTNSIVHTSDLELRAPLFRLAYRGAADLTGRVNARVEARLLRDAWVVGPLVSLIFSPLTKLFEYHVTGTLERPEMELLNIPKPLQLPLHPIGTIRDMIEDDRPSSPPL
jgi:hypothetical protein